MMRIIDAHAHLGHDVVFDESTTREERLYWHAQCGVWGAIVQPFVTRPYIEDVRAIHDEIAAFSKDYLGRIFGMASIPPHLREAEYEQEATRCIKELGFVGIKLTPIAHACHPNSKAGRHVFEIAQALNVPIMVHTGAGAPFADPAALENPARDFPHVPIILAHAGTDLYFAQALSLAQRYEHVYLEPSWVNLMNVRKAVKTIGARRIMFSSDHADNIPVELAKYRAAVEDPRNLEQILCRTAVEVFNLDSRLASEDV